MPVANVSPAKLIIIKPLYVVVTYVIADKVPPTLYPTTKNSLDPLPRNLLLRYTENEPMKKNRARTIISSRIASPSPQALR